VKLGVLHSIGGTQGSDSIIRPFQHSPLPPILASSKLTY
jgi:hypothetical protein